MEWASREELVEFANRVREAGGGDVIEALLPSKQSSPFSCLIARALNFECSVFPCASWDDGAKQVIRWPNGDYVWVMYTSNKDLLYRLADELDLEIISDPASGDVLKLPQRIGNAARAFDAGLDFQEFANGPG